ncbi:MAG: V-type ATP synthase subunit F [Verrucomicrobia bacterium]|nr:V-type ATP synthase subunit F [Verrucomicrobiota bacterium]
MHVLGDEDTVLGFRLAGIRGTVAERGEGLAEQFRQLVNDEQVQVVFITERLAAGIRQLVDAYRMRATFPVVVEIPDGQGPMPGRRAIADLIREAIGFQV